MIGWSFREAYFEINQKIRTVRLPLYRYRQSSLYLLIVLSRYSIYILCFLIFSYQQISFGRPVARFLMTKVGFWGSIRDLPYENIRVLASVQNANRVSLVRKQMSNGHVYIYICMKGVAILNSNNGRTIVISKYRFFKCKKHVINLRKVIICV